MHWNLGYGSSKVIKNCTIPLIAYSTSSTVVYLHDMTANIITREISKKSCKQRVRRVPIGVPQELQPYVVSFPTVPLKSGLRQFIENGTSR